ncbi:SLC35B1 [Cordylochernes scorpioides]|uniref:SLC35B1 n=1 Tax=Cordylochernes scorpioides TaxID=51811 RepID=A0ABY6LBJ8_9ARAC|nr:SLC35B1 [Cordylochernes scorpioides]
MLLILYPWVQVLHTLLKQGVDHTRHMYYASAAFSYLGAMVSSNMALQHVNFPTQVVGKSCKPIPVMLLGVLIGRKRYSLAKYCFVMLIVLGVGLFMYKDKPSTASSDGLGMGELLLLISLALDGFTGAIQERMKSDHKTKSVHMMYNMNLWSSLFLVVCILLKGEMGPFLQFVQTYPFVISNIVLLSGASALGQLFIFLTVTEFGPLPCSLVTTLRKFFTILFSVIFFGNSLVARQWLGATLVFTGTYPIAL